MREGQEQRGLGMGLEPDKDLSNQFFFYITGATAHSKAAHSKELTN